ncbi:MAG: glycoside hydrolase family 130 protein [Planctomycetota bacterium]|nr:glycoside hydrolase family 130 protein [Planctomycetota bacterium]
MSGIKDVKVNDYQLQRHGENPLLSPADFPGALSVFNCGQAMMGDETILLVSIIHRSGSYRGIPGDATTHVARSTDGVKFDIDPEPFLKKPDFEPFSKVVGGVIDTRVTYLEGWYYIIHPGGGWGTLGVLGRTKDFREFEYIDVVSLPDNRVPCLFPGKIGGYYMRLDRPYRVAPDEHHTDGNIWLARSPDLVHWGHFRPMLKPGFAPWARTKIGPTPPIRTEKGWLTIIHGVRQSCAGYRYCLGAMLLDLENPERIVGLIRGSILSPDTDYERTGVVPNVVFTCGAIADEDDDRIRVYYGGADTCICLASGSLNGLISACLCDGPPDR